MSQGLGPLRQGVIGYFNSLDPGRTSDLDKWERGHLQLKEDGYAHVVTLDERSVPSFESGHAGRELLGVTENGGVLLLDIPGRGFSTSFGGAKASVFRYRAGTMLVGVNPDRVRSPRLHGAAIDFYGLGAWAGISGSTTSFERDDQGRLQSWSATLRSADELESRTSLSRMLTLSSYWRVDGPEDRRTLHTPLRIGIHARRPRSARLMLEPLGHIQQLASFAFGGFLPAETGCAWIDSAGGEALADLWDRRLMKPPDLVDGAKSSAELPLFSLSSLGGLPVLARWIKLNESHWRAAAPVMARFRVGAGMAETRLLDICAGIEYWVAFHRHGRAVWARERLWPLAVARRVSAEFAAWVGDIRTWADALWEAYNALKHNPGALLDPWRVYLLAESARFLLGAALVDRAAGSRSASSQIFKSHRIRALGVDLRSELNT